MFLLLFGFGSKLSLWLHLWLCGDSEISIDYMICSAIPRQIVPEACPVPSPILINSTGLHKKLALG